VDNKTHKLIQFKIYSSHAYSRKENNLHTLTHKQAHKKPHYLTDCTMVSSKSDSGKQKESNPEN
jgi:hypothetical protein